MIDTEDAGLRLAVYARVSTEEQGNGQTIDSQIAEIRRSFPRQWVDYRSHIQG
jgi:DNA invertase Pin-like site-specific DNA recombinase